MNSFFGLIACFTFVFVMTTAFANEKNSLAATQEKSDSPLFSAKDLEKLSPDEKERYFDALREFFQENQAEPQTFSQYFMDILSGEFLANAAPYSSGIGKDSSDACDIAIFQNVTAHYVYIDKLKNDPACFNRWLDQMGSGNLGNCKFENPAGQPGTNSYGQTKVLCKTNAPGSEEKTRLYTFYDMPEERKSRTEQAIKKNPNTNGAQYLSADEAEKKLTALSTSPNSHDAPKSPTSIGASGGGAALKTPAKAADAPTATKGKDTLARCFYAGFVINKHEKVTSCVAVQDLCASNQRVLPAQSGIQKALGCSNTPKKFNSSCVSKDESKGKIAAGKKNNEVVACNPLLFGLSGSADPKSVICVKRSGNASQNCLEKMKLDENATKNLDALLKNADGSKAFNELKSEIEKQCKPYWKFKEGASDQIKDEDARKMPAKTPTNRPRPTQAGTPAAASGATPADSGEGIDEAVKGRNEKANMDFNRTCKVLLNRVREIKPSAAGAGKPTPAVVGAPAKFAK